MQVHFGDYLCLFNNNKNNNNNNNDNNNVSFAQHKFVK